METMKPLFLVGYMGCGKSTLGRKLARRLGVEYVDTDHEVEQTEGAAVVSTGGGLPTWSDNMARMNAVGRTVYLRRSAENIASRLSPYGRQKRPRLRGLNDEELVIFMREDMAKRDPYYSQAVQVVACEGNSDEEIIREIVDF